MMSNSPYLFDYLVKLRVRDQTSNLHKIGDEEVVLQSTDSFLRQDGRLSTNWTRQGQRLRGDVVLETAGRKGLIMNGRES